MSSAETRTSLALLDFVGRRHDLDALRSSMELALRKAACRVYAMQALSWLLRVVTQPYCVHDILWWLVSSLAPAVESAPGGCGGAAAASASAAAAANCGADNAAAAANNAAGAANNAAAAASNAANAVDHAAAKKDNLVGQHPTSDVALAGEGLAPLLNSFHSLLQTVSDLMQSLPMSTPLLTMAVRCWDVRFRQSDHAFLHRSHVFSNISRILSRCEEEAAVDIEAQDANTLQLVVRFISFP